ncbi:MAG: hypothetical protein D6703_07145 [Zetaproteobacteria bacterium]|nr:MAG: hypothetical protein D6703_07145 [Zetaproteobacteria bacterium]
MLLSTTSRQSEHAEFFKASDNGMAEELKRQSQLDRLKRRRHGHHERVQSSRACFGSSAGAESMHEEQPVKTAARFEMLAKPVSVDEAVMQLEPSGRDELVLTTIG